MLQQASTVNMPNYYPRKKQKKKIISSAVLALVPVCNILLNIHLYSGTWLVSAYSLAEWEWNLLDVMKEGKPGFFQTGSLSVGVHTSRNIKYEHDAEASRATILPLSCILLIDINGLSRWKVKFSCQTRTCWGSRFTAGTISINTQRIR